MFPYCIRSYAEISSGGRNRFLYFLYVKEANLPVPDLVLLKSPFRFVVKPIVEYALDLEKENVEKHVAVILGGEESSGELLRTGAG